MKKHSKLIALSLSLVAVLTLAFAQVSSAQNVRAGDRVAVAADETVDSMLFLGGNNIDIAGIVNGDVYCAGQNVTISGIVNGDVICAAQTLSISGKVQGSVRLAAQSVVLGGTVSGSATVASQTLLVEKTGIVQRDLVGGTQTATIDGIVTRDVAVGAANLTVNGQVGRSITGEVETLAVGSSGVVDGDVRYSSDNSPVISSGGKIAGTVTRTPFEHKQDNKAYSPFAFHLSTFVFTFVTMLILALVVALLFPLSLRETTLRAIASPGRTVLTGVVGVIVAPVLVVVLMASVIGLPLGLLALFTWFIVVLLSGPVVAYLVGYLLLKKEKRPVVVMLLGASLLLVVYFIPILGFLVMLATYVFGVGMIFDKVISHRNSVPKERKKIVKESV